MESHVWFCDNYLVVDVYVVHVDGSHVWFRDNYLVVTVHLTMCLSHSRTFSNHYACLYIVLSYQIKFSSVSIRGNERATVRLVSHGTIGDRDVICIW